MDSADANQRKAIIRSVWSTAGRSSEVAWCNWDGFEYDDHFKCVFGEVFQVKVTKMKLVAFMAGADRHCDWNLDMADYLASNVVPVYNASEPTWVFPCLQGTGYPGTKVGGFIKALLPTERGGTPLYANVAVNTIPEGCNGAGGIRPGACMTLAAHMPAEILVHTTGHDLRGQSALWEYVDVDRPLCVVGALVLAGWQALPWGQLGMGPTPPSLQPLQDCGYVAITALETTIDHYFNLHDHSPPKLQCGGSLRPWVHVIFASTIMYYNQRVATMALPTAQREQSALLTKLQGAIRGTLKFHCPHTTLSEWSEIIFKSFNVANLHLTCRDKDTNITQARTSTFHPHPNGRSEYPMVAQWSYSGHPMVDQWS